MQEMDVQVGEGAVAGDVAVKGRYGPDNRPKGGSKKGRRLPSKLLMDMRWVARYPEGEGGTAFQKKLQESLRKDPLKFAAYLGRLEGEHRVGVRKAEEPVAAEGEKKDEVAGADAGAARVAELIDRLLDEWPGVGG